MKQPHVARQEGTLCVIWCDVRTNSVEQSPSEAVSLSGNQEMPSLYETWCTLPLVPVLDVRVAFKHPKFFTAFFYLPSSTWYVMMDNTRCREIVEERNMPAWVNLRSQDFLTLIHLIAQHDAESFELRSRVEVDTEPSWNLKIFPFFFVFVSSPSLFIHMKLLAFVTLKLLLRSSRRLWRFTNSVSRPVSWQARV